MCGEFVEAAKQRRCGHSCQRCTSAAVMFSPPPRGHNKRESEHMGGRAVNHSQQGRCTSRPKTVVSWRINAPLPSPPLPVPPQTLSLGLSHRKKKKKKDFKKLRMTLGGTVRHASCQTGRMSNKWMLVGHLFAHEASSHSVWVPRLHPK